MTNFDLPSMNNQACLRFVFALLMSTGMTGAWAQSGNVTNGKNLFENTAATTGKPALMSCTACHGSVENRRLAITQATSPYAALSFDQAAGALGTAIVTQPDMAQFRGQFTGQQFNDLAAYLADVPRFDKEDGIGFAAAAVGQPVEQSLTLTQAQLPSASLEVLSVTIGGTGAAQFSKVNDNCELQTLAAGISCVVTIRYQPTGTAGATAFVSYALRQGGADFTRGVDLTGTVGSTPPPTTGGGGNSDSGGGGALGFEWLAALGLAVAALARVMRATRVSYVSRVSRVSRARRVG